MARKRMFDLEIINQDSFLDLPMESKALYFLLGMEADDEGFINPKKVLRLYGGTEDSLKVLIAKKFIIPFSTGVIVITDWKRNNYLDKKRVKETIYQEEKSQLTYNEKTEKYECLTNVKQMLNQNRIEENSIEYKKEKNKKKKEKYYGNEELNNLFNEFLELRKKIKCKNTDRAINLLLKKLNNYDDETKKQMLEQSIMNSWKSVYELKNKKEASMPSWMNKKYEEETDEGYKQFLKEIEGYDK